MKLKKGIGKMFSLLLAVAMVITGINTNAVNANAKESDVVETGTLIMKLNRFVINDAYTMVFPEYAQERFYDRLDVCSSLFNGLANIWNAQGQEDIVAEDVKSSAVLSFDPERGEQGGIVLRVDGVETVIDSLEYEFEVVETDGEYAVECTIEKVGWIEMKTEEPVKVSEAGDRVTVSFTEVDAVNGLTNLGYLSGAEEKPQETKEPQRKQVAIEKVVLNVKPRNLKEGGYFVFKYQEKGWETEKQLIIMEDTTEIVLTETQGELINLGFIESGYGWDGSFDDTYVQAAGEGASLYVSSVVINDVYELVCGQELIFGLFGSGLANIWNSIEYRSKDDSAVFGYQSGRDTLELYVVPSATVVPTPGKTPSSEITPTPEASLTPEKTPSSGITPTPEVSLAPESMPPSEITPTPEVSLTPEETPPSGITPTPEISLSPEETPLSGITPTPGITPSSGAVPTPKITSTPMITCMPVETEDLEEEDVTEATRRIKVAEDTVVVAAGRTVTVPFRAIADDEAERAAEVTAESGNRKIARAFVEDGEVRINVPGTAKKGAYTTVTLESEDASGDMVEAEIRVYVRNTTKSATPEKRMVVVRKGRTARVTIRVTAENPSKMTTDTILSEEGAASVKKIATVQKVSAKKGKVIVTIRAHRRSGTKIMTVRLGRVKAKVKIIVK